MKTIYYNNRIAKLILFGRYTTIMLFGLILTKLQELSEATIRHERTHRRQFLECMEIAAIPSVLLAIHVSPWWLLLIPLLYYILYLAEWLISFVYHLFTDSKIGGGKVNANAYRASAFEMEAKFNQDNPNYLEERKWGAWIKYYGKV
ncbi:hypothetical protein [uncultured Bacteroides sp.]|uniref:hypothetical protein n=1 Tax=uncultured Bacteroides sp. TaxID=162156 RepID=UPI0025F1265E|nr:hypothetical protein [uncultured Bacteroides sp.]